MQPPPTSDPTLSYAARPRIGRGRRVTWALIGVSAVASAVTAVHWIGPLRERAQLLYWQHACLTYAPPPGATTTVGVTTTAAAAPWQAFSTLMTPPGVRSGGTLFLHERTSPGGNRRLVVVDDVGSLSCGPVLDGGVRVDLEQCVARVIRPGSPARPPTEVTPNAGVGVWVRPLDVFLPAAADPADPSHFQIRCRRQARPEVVIDGWLRDDDTVAFSTSDVLPAPLTPALPPGTRRRTVAP